MIGWAVDTLAASTLLMLAVLTLRGPFARRFGAHAAYALWLLPALRMLLPRLPDVAVPTSVVRFHIDPARLLAARHSAPVLTAQSALSAPVIDWLTTGLLLWLGGAVLYLVWQLVRHRRLMKIALEHAESSARLGRIHIRRSPLVSGPFAAGILRRHVLLPEDFDRRYSPAEQQLALAHELAHHRRGDLVANAAAIVFLALHWFNPIAHWAYRAFRADQELACDATVLGAESPERRADYGRALIKAAQAGRPAASVCALGPTTQLRRRIMMITQSRRSRACRVGGLALVTTLTGLGLGLTASGSIASPSKMAPAALAPLLQPEPSRQLAMAEAGHEHTTPAMTAKTELVVSPSAPTPPTAPTDVVAAVPPSPPVTPTPLSTEQVRAISEEASRAAAEAGEQARQAMAKVDYSGMQREALAEARAELERECKHAKPAPAGETDTAAITRLSLGCADVGNAVQEGMRAAIEEIRKNTELSEAQKASIIAALDQTRTALAGQFSH